MKPLQKPKDHITCPVCNRAYSFIRCRFTKAGKNMCLECAGKQEKVMHTPA
jgi:hypothetical protein